MVIQYKYTGSKRQYNKWIQRLCNEGRSNSTDGINTGVSYSRDGIKTEINKARADHIKKFPTAKPRDSGISGVRPDTIPIIDVDRGEKERGNSHSRVEDCT